MNAVGLTVAVRTRVPAACSSGNAAALAARPSTSRWPTPARLQPMGLVPTGGLSPLGACPHWGPVPIGGLDPLCVAPRLEPWGYALTAARECQGGRGWHPGAVHGRQGRPSSLPGGGLESARPPLLQHRGRIEGHATAYAWVIPTARAQLLGRQYDICSWKPPAADVG
jgi:hypothetical protein